MDTIDQTMTDIHDFIVNENSSHKVVIWAKSYCPYCKQTKATFKSMSDLNDIVIYDLDLRPDGNEIQEELLTITGQRSVPNVFVMNQHIGGNDDVQDSYVNGKLKELLGL